MKKTITISVLALAVLACHRKTIPSTEIVISNKPIVTAKNEPAKTDVPNSELEILGKTVYTTKCSRCHGLKTVANYTADRWSGILRSMTPKAHLTDDEAKEVTAYVMANAKK